MTSLSLDKVVIGKFLGVIFLMKTVVNGFSFGVDGLSMEYYLLRCPSAELIVKTAVIQALEADPKLAATLVWLHFHDCFIEGCDRSVLIDSTKQNIAEKDSLGSLSLRGFEVIDKAKEQLQNVCPGVVSCADILAMAARTVFWAGGPLNDIPNGRMDGKRKIEDIINLPAPFFNASQLINMFGQRGFSAQEMVALSGAHTLGMARCASYKKHLMHGTDPDLDSGFAKTLFKTCSAGDTAEQPFDATRTTFDNLYHNALQRKAGVLSTDQILYASAETKRYVNGYSFSYAFNQARFFFDFQQAMVKLSKLDVKEGSKGEERRNCHKIN
ncbi:peroxidase 47-like [Castanea sativa]|uniref:peroxidase 47-like n=1 Tax=Castanea sativa TaxID=21020 RepID=UPI003F652D2A